MTVPVGQFRKFDITGAEPSDRTSEGDVVSESMINDFGLANNTSGADYLGPVCVIYRISNLGGNSSVSAMKFALVANSVFDDGNTDVFLDITNTWTQNKTTEQVVAGTPGIAPKSFPASGNLQKNGGGVIAGIDHANTSQYIYIVLKVGQNESVGTDKGGSAGTFRHAVQANYSA